MPKRSFSLVQASAALDTGVTYLWQGNRVNYEYEYGPGGAGR